MSKDAEWKSIAVLIDADNAQPSKIKMVLDEISTYGRIAAKKAYGNWKDEKLKNWEPEIKKLAIKPEQQFAYTVGKNATDISLTISAMDLLYSDIYDAFVLVSSDSDYTPLAIRLRESGVAVLGVGEKKTPEPFRNACDEFILTEHLSDMISPAVNAASTPPAEDKASAKTVDENSIEYIHGLLKISCDTYQDDDGWVNVGAAGNYIKRVKPDFNVRAYGYSKLSDLIKAHPKLYRYKSVPGKGTGTIFVYMLA